MSEDARSVAYSETSEVTASGTTRRRRVQRTSTTFHLAHPAPTLTQKQRILKIRPRLILQLQRLSPDSRPEPAVDVLPSTVVIPRLAQKFPRMFRGKAELGVNDVMVVQSEEYNTQDDGTTEAAESDEENLANRDLLAVICQMPKDAGGSQGKAEIVLGDGSVWVATPLPNCLYEFVTVDDNGNKTTARWVKRSTQRHSADFSSPTFSSSGGKYTFSIIDPNSRRHPIQGSLTQNTLDIPDFYTTVSSSAKKYPPTTHFRHFPGGPDTMDDEPTTERTTHTIDENMKKLIQVTGIWVALRQGLSPYFKYNDVVANSSPATNCRTVSHGRSRSVSLTPDARLPSLVGPGTSSPESGHSTVGAVGGKLRRSRTNGPALATPTTPLPQLDGSTAPKRSTSAGFAFMQRAAARRASRPPSTVQSDTDVESVFRRPRRSMTEYGALVTPPPSLTLPGSSATTPDTPTRPQRRVQSAYIPSNLPQTGQTITFAARHSAEVPVRDEDLKWVEKPKISRWKAFTNLFRRAQTRSA
jgi:hypothetical protein